TRDFLDVGSRVATHPLGIAAEHFVNLIAANVLPVRARDAEVTRHRLAAVTGQLACGEIVSQDCVHGIDQLAAWGDQPDPTASVDARDTAASRSFAQTGRPR